MLQAYAGLGKILYLGSDAFWRWRYRARWEYHHRFWGQIILWATLGRTTGVDKNIKLMSERAEYSPDETVSLKARILDNSGKGLLKATVSSGIYNENGKLIKNIRFSYIPNSAGEYRANIKDLPIGQYKVLPRVQEMPENDGLKAKINFQVRHLPTSEYIELSRNDEFLRRFSDHYEELMEADKIISKVPEININKNERIEYELWDNLWFIGIIAILLGLEWQLRKKNKLV